MRCLDIGVVKNHLLNKGFTPGYTEWYHHGERRMIEAASETNQRGVGGLHDALHDLMDHEDFDDFTDPTPSEVRADEQVEHCSLSWKQNCTLGAKSFCLCRSWFR